MQVKFLHITVQIKISSFPNKDKTRKQKTYTIFIYFPFLSFIELYQRNTQVNGRLEVVPFFDVDLAPVVCAAHTHSSSPPSLADQGHG